MRLRLVGLGGVVNTPVSQLSLRDGWYRPMVPLCFVRGATPIRGCPIPYVAGLPYVVAARAVPRAPSSLTLTCHLAVGARPFGSGGWGAWAGSYVDAFALGAEEGEELYGVVGGLKQTP